MLFGILMKAKKLYFWDSSLHMVILKSVEVINKAKQPNQTQSGTNIQH
jgi:hypothetical protein